LKLKTPAWPEATDKEATRSMAARPPTESPRGHGHFTLRAFACGFGETSLPGDSRGRGSDQRIFTDQFRK
jgi:hypothetical protein